MDLPTLRRLRERFDPLFVTGLGNGRHLRSLGRVEELDWWQTLAVGELKVTMTPALHFSRRGFFDTCRSLWGGFFLEGARRIYFAGDTAYGSHFEQIRRRLGQPDVSLLPIGAYEPRWLMQSVHVNPAEAVRAHRDLGSPLSIGMHFGTFQLTDEAIDAPLEALADTLREGQVAPDAFRVLDFGETLTLE